MSTLVDLGSDCAVKILPVDYDLTAGQLVMTEIEHGWLAGWPD